MPMAANFHEKAMFHEEDAVLEESSSWNMVAILDFLAF